MLEARCGGESAKTCPLQKRHFDVGVQRAALKTDRERQFDPATHLTDVGKGIFDD